MEEPKLIQVDFRKEVTDLVVASSWPITNYDQIWVRNNVSRRPWFYHATSPKKFAINKISPSTIADPVKPSIRRLNPAIDSRNVIKDDLEGSETALRCFWQNMLFLILLPL